MSKNTLDDLKERIKRINEYHREEYAKRLDEIGGPGVGGTELEYSPLQGVFSADTPGKEKQLVLIESISELWEEATWSYVYGHFRACIILLAIMIERALKLELEKKKIGAKGKQLGSCIKCCKTNGVFPNNDNNDIVKAAKFINEIRNDVVHANIELNRPKSLLYHTGPEHEVEEIKDLSKNIKVDEGGNLSLTGDGEYISFNLIGKPSAKHIYLYKKAAKDAIKEAGKILKYLFQNNGYSPSATSYNMV